MYADGAVAHGCGERQLAGPQFAPRVQKRIASLEVEAAKADVALIEAAAAHSDAIAGALGIFLDNDVVCSRRHGGTGEDAYRLASRDGAGKQMAGCSFADHLQLGRKARQIRRAHRVAVHGRGVEWWLGELGSQRLGQHAAARGLDGDRLSAERLRIREDAGKGVLD
jgi:hypothetical protein